MRCSMVIFIIIALAFCMTLTSCKKKGKLWKICEGAKIFDIIMHCCKHPQKCASKAGKGKRSGELDFIDRYSLYM